VSQSTKDPIRLELLKNAFAAIADEMAVTVVRTARSYVIKEAMDFSTGLMDAEGGLIAQGLCLPIHMGSFPPTMQAVLDEFRGQLAPGDIYAVNDPYIGGGIHLPDIFVFQPIFFEGRLLGFATAIGHQTDIGGRVAGGNACDNTEIFQEGLRIPPLKLFDRGVPNETLFKLLKLNVRVPEKVIGDVMATVAACHRGERGVLELAQRYGTETILKDMRDLQDYSEEITRAELMEFPDGEWEFEDFIDNDGFDPGPIRIRVKLIKAGGDLTVDFAGTSRQVKGSINMPISLTHSCVYACVRSVLDPSIPTNSGFMRPIHLHVEPGTIVNPTCPAPVAARGLTAMRTTEAVWGALARMLPHKVFACGVQGDFGVTIAGSFTWSFCSARGEGDRPRTASMLCPPWPSITPIPRWRCSRASSRCGSSATRFGPIRADPGNTGADSGWNANTGWSTWTRPCSRSGAIGSSSDPTGCRADSRAPRPRISSTPGPPTSSTCQGSS
jgi:N-methylhydantoinase B